MKIKTCEINYYGKENKIYQGELSRDNRLYSISVGNVSKLKYKIQDKENPQSKQNTNISKKRKSSGHTF